VRDPCATALDRMPGLNYQRKHINIVFLFMSTLFAIVYISLLYLNTFLLQCYLYLVLIITINVIISLKFRSAVMKLEYI
jgi:hypothetical protein